jgi:DNA repair protein RecN (Recombination protein N)
MLVWLKIRNLALVESEEIDFYPGFNVITGETGAGKSVIMGSLNLLLGARADKGVIRTGAKNCEIQAAFNLKSEALKSLNMIIEELGINPIENGELIIRRVLTATSSRNYVNDSTVTLQTLKRIGDNLIDIHGANEHQSLVKLNKQLELLDKYGHLDVELAECLKYSLKLRELATEKEKATSSIISNVEAVHYRMVKEEIENIAPEENEDEVLSKKHSIVANSKTILESLASGVSILSESEDSIIDKLVEVRRILGNISDLDQELSLFSDQCESLIDNVKELAFDLEKYSSNVELDEEEFFKLENRLAEIQGLKRKYGPYLVNVFEALNEADDKLSIFDNSEEKREYFKVEEERLSKKLKESGQKLSKKRKSVAKVFEKEIEAELSKLGFKDAEFEIVFKEIEPSKNGLDKVDYYFSANPGEKKQPLRNIASSGEMSRLMLALKTVLASADDVPVLIFDEIDANIGGETAVTVGESLRGLASSHQIISISHLPQVAAQAINHYKVVKEVRDDRTFTSIKELDHEMRVDEISRMLGGGEAAVNHAKELLQ